MTVTRRRQSRSTCLGEQARQLGAPCRFQLPEYLLVGADCRAPEGIDPGSEGQDRVALVRAPDQHATALLQRVRGQGAEQARLPNTRLSHHDGHLPALVQSPSKNLPQALQLLLPSNQRHLRRREVEPSGARSRAAG